MKSVSHLALHALITMVIVSVALSQTEFQSANSIIQEFSRIRELHFPGDQLDLYDSGHKTLMYFSGGIKLGAWPVRAKVIVYFDFDDLVGKTREGTEGWVSCWIDVEISANISVSKSRLPMGFGFVVLDRTATYDDPPRKGSVSLISGHILGVVPIGLLEVSGDAPGAQKYVSAKSQTGISSLFDLSIAKTTINASRFEIRRDMIITIMEGAMQDLHVGSNGPREMAQVAERVVSSLVSSSSPGQLLPTLQGSQIRRFTNSDAPTILSESKMGFMNIGKGTTAYQANAFDLYVNPSSTTPFNQNPTQFMLNYYPDDYESGDFRIRVSNVPSGWDVQVYNDGALRGSTWTEYSAPPSDGWEVLSTSWGVSCSQSAPASANVRFVLYRLTLGGLFGLGEIPIDTLDITFMKPDFATPHVLAWIPPTDPSSRLKVGFSKPMNTASLQYSTHLRSNIRSSVPFIEHFDVSDNSYSIVPTEDIDGPETFEVTVAAAAQDAFGVSIGHDVTYTFAKVQNSLSLLSPNGGETIFKDNSQIISWSPGNDPGPFEVRLVGPSSKTLIATNIAASSYEWKVVGPMPIASNYRIELRSLSTSSTDISNSVFAIADTTPRPILTISPSSMAFNLPLNSVESRLITLENLGVANLIWNVKNNAAWIQVGTLSGDITPSSPRGVLVSVSSSGFNAGMSVTYNLHFTSTGGNIDLPVTMNVVGNNPPDIRSGEVNPGSGDDTTTFTFSVDYRDLDGDAPTVKSIMVDEIEYAMHSSLAHPDYSSYTKYLFTKKLLPNIPHSYHFVFRDGKGGEDRLPQSGSFTGPVVAPVEPRIGLLQPSITNQLADSTFDIMWYAVGVSTVSLYFDSDQNPNNGMTLIVANTPNDSCFTWDTRWIPNGSYYVHGVADNQGVIDARYSARPVIINHGAYIPSVNFGPRVIVGNGSSPRGQVHNGQISLVYSDGNRIIFKRSTNLGDTWVDSASLSTTVGVSDPWMAASGDSLFVAWTQSNIGTYRAIYFSQSFNKGLSWTSPISLTVGDVVSSNDPVVLAFPGRVCAIWQKKGSNSRWQFFRRLLDRSTGNWNSTAQVTSVSGDDIDGGMSGRDAIAVGSSVYIAFKYSSADQNVRLVKSDDEGQSFSGISNLPDVNSRGVSFPRLVGTSAGVYCTWVESNIQIAFTADGASTWSVRTPLPTSNNSPNGIAYAQGRIDVVDFDNKYYESTDGGFSWATPVLFDSTYSSNYMHLFSKDDRRYVFFLSSNGLAFRGEPRENTPPFISLNLETQRTVFADSVGLSWTTFDPDGPLGPTVRLNFTKSDSTHNGTIESGLSPVGSHWWNVFSAPAGFYDIRATVTDDKGSVGVSEKLHIEINHSPIITFNISTVDTILGDLPIRWSVYDHDSDTNIVSRVFATMGTDSMLLGTFWGMGQKIFTWAFDSIPKSSAIRIGVLVSDGVSGSRTYYSSKSFVKTTGFAVKGIVVNAAAQPVTGIAVRIWGPLFLSCVTDQFGKFEFTGLRPGVYSLSVNVDSVHESMPLDFNLDVRRDIDTIRFTIHSTTPVPNDETIVIPQSFYLHQNAPNPFNPSTSIRYDLPSRCFVRVRVYDVLGRQIAILADGEHAAGIYQVIWNATSSSGVYFYMLEANSIDEPSRRFMNSRRMILLR